MKMVVFAQFGPGGKPNDAALFMSALLKTPLLLPQVSLTTRELSLRQLFVVP